MTDDLHLPNCNRLMRRCWAFTSKDLTDKKHWEVHDRIGHKNLVAYEVGLERGETGYVHYQGRFALIAPSCFCYIKKNFLPTDHFEIEKSGTCHGRYVKKEGQWLSIGKWPENYGATYQYEPYDIKAPIVISGKTVEAGLTSLYEPINEYTPRPPKVVQAPKGWATATDHCDAWLKAKFARPEKKGD